MACSSGSRRFGKAFVFVTLLALVAATGCEEKSASVAHAPDGEEGFASRRRSAREPFPSFFHPRDNDIPSEEPVAVPRIVSLPTTGADRLAAALHGLYHGAEHASEGPSPKDRGLATSQASPQVIPGCRNPSLADVAIRRITRVGREQTTILAPEPSACFYDGQRVLDARTGQRHGSLGLGWYRRSRSALSPSGHTLAIALPMFRQDSPEIILVNVAEGKIIKKLGASILGKDASFYARHLAFVANRKLAILRGHGSRESETIVLDLEADKVVQRFPIESFSRRHAAFSPGGRYLAVGHETTLWLYDVVQGRLLAELLPLKSTPSKPSVLASTPVFSWSGKEVAVLTRDRRLLCWDVQGRLAFNRVLLDVGQQAMPGRRRERALAWLPDGKGWLLDHAALFSREHEMVVWRLLYHGNSLCRFLDQNTLLTTRPLADGEEVVAVGVPWKAIGDSLRAMDTGRVLARPGDAVQLVIETPQTRRGPPELRSQLVDFCAAAGLEVVEDDAPLRLEARFVVAGKAATLITPDGRHIPLTNAALRKADVGVALRLVRNDTEEVLWKFSANSKEIPAVLILGEEPSAAKRRMFSMIRLALTAPLLPSLVPEQPDLPQLPLVTPLD